MYLNSHRSAQYDAYRLKRIIWDVRQHTHQFKNEHICPTSTSLVSSLAAITAPLPDRRSPTASKSFMPSPLSKGTLIIFVGFVVRLVNLKMVSLNRTGPRALGRGYQIVD